MRLSYRKIKQLEKNLSEMVEEINKTITAINSLSSAVREIQNYIITEYNENNDEDDDEEYTLPTNFEINSIYN